MSREAMEMALNALTAWDARGRLRVIEALRTALAQPESEPVAWLRPIFMIEDGWDEFGFTKSSDEDVPLYTAPPPPRKPLSDDELLAALKSVDTYPTSETARLPNGFKLFARAIEAAHGIKEK